MIPNKTHLQSVRVASTVASCILCDSRTRPIAPTTSSMTQSHTSNAARCSRVSRSTFRRNALFKGSTLRELLLISYSAEMTSAAVKRLRHAARQHVSWPASGAGDCNVRDGFPQHARSLRLGQDLMLAKSFERRSAPDCRTLSSKWSSVIEAVVGHHHTQLRALSRNN
jgi:hypothetical protein